MTIDTQLQSASGQNRIREPAIALLLDKLQELDELFYYNVPAKIRETSTDKLLYEYLERVYGEKEFVIEDPDLIKRYIQAGDRVRKKGDYKKTQWSLQPGDKGLVDKMYDDGKIKCSFNDKSVDLWPREVLIYGRWGFWSDTIFPVKSKGDTYANLYHDLISFRYTLLVEYIGESREENSFHIPNNTQGIVHRDDRDSAPLVISWQRGKGVIAYDRLDERDKGHQLHYFKYEDIKLVRDNPIPFQKLAQECGVGKTVDGIEPEE